MALWFLIAGWSGLLFNRPITPPCAAGILLGFLFFVFLVLALRRDGRRVVWVQWWPIPARLWRWPILALACLPWFLAAGYSQWGAGGGAGCFGGSGRACLSSSGSSSTLMLAPSIGFLVLLMPLLPLIFLVLAVGAAAFDRPWPYAIGSAFFFGWMISVVFPLA